MSIAIAVVAWLYVVYNVSPMIQKTYRDVPIIINGEYELGMNGLGILSKSSDTLKVTVSIDRKDVKDMTSDKILAEVDATELTEGINTCTVKVTAPEGKKLVSQSVQTIDVEVTKSNNIDVPVLAGYSTSLESNTEPSIVSSSAKMVSVMGAEKNISKVEYVLLPFNETHLSISPRTFTVEPVACAADGRIVKDVVVLPSTVSATVFKASVKSVPLELSVSKGSRDDITVTYPETVKIKGTQGVLSSISSIKADSIDVSGFDKSGYVTINCQLPAGAELANDSAFIKVKVKVK